MVVDRFNEVQFTTTDCCSYEACILLRAFVEPRWGTLVQISCCFTVSNLINEVQINEDRMFQNVPLKHVHLLETTCGGKKSYFFLLYDGDEGAGV
jgi:hypothetical protein